MNNDPQTIIQKAEAMLSEVSGEVKAAFEGLLNHAKSLVGMSSVQNTLQSDVIQPGTALAEKAVAAAEQSMQTAASGVGTVIAEANAAAVSAATASLKTSAEAEVAKVVEQVKAAPAAVEAALSGSAPATAAPVAEAPVAQPAGAVDTTAAPAAASAPATGA